MLIMERHKIIKDKKCVAVLRVYLEGSGDPKDEHQIVSVSVDEYGIGRIPEKVDIIKDMEDIQTTLHP